MAIRIYLYDHIVMQLYSDARIVPAIDMQYLCQLRYSDRDRGTPLIWVGSHSVCLHTDTQLSKSNNMGLYIKNKNNWGTISSSGRM